MICATFPGSIPGEGHGFPDIGLLISHTCHLDHPVLTTFFPCGSLIVDKEFFAVFFASMQDFQTYTPAGNPL